jgi:hypothetical protein
MKLIALSQLTGLYGQVQTGQEFEVADDLGAELLRLGHVRPALPPAVTYETKVIVPQEPSTVGARRPFRDVPVSDAESKEVDPPRRPVVSDPDIPEPRTTDPGGRRGHPRPSPHK